MERGELERPSYNTAVPFIGFFCAFISGSIVLSNPVYDQSSGFDETAWLSLGVIHAVAILPAFYVSKRLGVGMIIAMIGAITFPIWGYVTGMVCFGPALPSLIWTLIIAAVFNRTLAWLGVASACAICCIPWYLIWGVQLSHSTERFIVESIIPAWHFLATFGIYVGICLTRNAPKESVFCQACGYSLIGLTTDRCPECGHEFSQPSLTA